MGLKYYLRGLGVGIIVTALIMGIATGVGKETLSDEEIIERARELGMVEPSTVLADTVDAAADVSGTEDETEPSPTPYRKDEEGKATATPVQEEEEAFSDQESEMVSGLEDESVAVSASPSVTPVRTPEATEKPSQTPAAAIAATKTPASTAAAGKEAEPSQKPTATVMPTATPSAVPEATPTASPVSSDSAGTSDEDDVTIRIEGGESSFTVCKKLEQAGLIESASEYDTYLCQNGYDKRIRAGSHVIPVGADSEEIAKILMKKN